MPKIPDRYPRLIHSIKGERLMKWFGHMYEALKEGREVWLLRTHKPISIQLFNI